MVIFFVKLASGILPNPAVILQTEMDSKLEYSWPRENSKKKEIKIHTPLLRYKESYKIFMTEAFDSLSLFIDDIR